MLIGSGNMWAVFGGLMILGVLHTCFSGTMPSTLPALFTTDIRYSALAIGFNLSVSVVSRHHIVFSGIHQPRGNQRCRTPKQRNRQVEADGQRTVTDIGSKQRWQRRRHSTMPSTLPALFTTDIRYSALAIGFNLSVSLFGGTTPLITAWLVDTTKNNMMPAYYRNRQVEADGQRTVTDIGSKQRWQRRRHSAAEAGVQYTQNHQAAKYRPHIT